MMALALALAAVSVLMFPGGRARRRMVHLSGSTEGRLHLADHVRMLRSRLQAVRRTGRSHHDRLRLAASLDLLAACLRAGLPVPEAVRAIAGGLPAGAARAMVASSELLALGADPEQAWQPALRHPETAPFARAARRSARSGAALAGVAAELAVRVRAELGDAAAARAQRAGVLIAGPLGLCFLPAFLCLGVIPVVVGLAGQLTTAP